MTAPRQDIQGLRAVAILLVVVFHAGLPLPGGFTGVDVFFVISGYFMTSLLVGDLANFGRIRFLNFYARRARRLLPALGVVTAATLIGCVLVQAPLGDEQKSAASGLASMLFAGNFAAAKFTSAGYFSTASAVDPYLHTWSLGVEEQFYLFFPALVLLCVLVGRRRGKFEFSRAVAIGIGIAFIASFTLSLLVSEQIGFGSIEPPGLAFYMFPTRIWEFTIGGAAALVPLLRLSSGAKTAMANALASGGAAAILIGAFTISGQTPFPGLAALLPAGGTAMLFYAGRLGTSFVGKVLAVRPLASIGDISYSWYLWHWPVAVFTTYLTSSHYWLVATTFGSILLAYATFYFVENPFRFDRVRFVRGRPARLAAITIASVSAMCVVATVGAYVQWGRSDLRALAASNVPALGERGGCTATGRVTRSSRTCEFTVKGSRQFVELVGDSHAGSLIDGVRRASAELGLSLVSRPASSCSFTPASKNETTLVPNCEQLYHWNLELALRQRPALVVISHDSSARADDSGGVQRWIDALRVSIDRLHAAGIRVLLVEDVPQIQSVPTTCRFGSVLPISCGIRRSYSERIKGPVRRAERRLVRSYRSGVSVYDPTGRFCSQTWCTGRAQDTMLYTDNQHLSEAGSLRISSDLRVAMSAAMASG